MFCNIVIMGNLGRDPETRYQTDGSAVTNFSIAVSRKRKGKDTTTWFRCVAWNKTAEIAGQYLKKGNPVLVQGEMMSRDYTDKDGVAHTSWEVTVNQLTLMPRSVAGGAPAGAPDDYSSQAGSDGITAGKPASTDGLTVKTNTAPTSKPASRGFDDFEDDIPF